jgi:hypothetical protein
MATPNTSGIHPASSFVRRKGRSTIQRPLATQTTTYGSGAGHTSGTDSGAGKDERTIKTGSNIRRR